MIWLLRRIATSLILVWVIASVVFVALHLVPGDPAELLLAQGGAAPDPEMVADLRAELGLDRPLGVQYLDHLSRLAQGDLGRSLQDKASVAQEIGRRLPRTLEMIAAALLLSLLCGMPAGVLAAVRRGSLFDRVLSTVSGITVALPVFIVGTLAVLVLAQNLNLMPAGGYVPFAGNPGRNLLLLTMPAGTIAVGLSSVVFRITRASVLDVMARDHVRAARGRGLQAWPILIWHIVYNALIPIITVVALNLGTLIGGTVLVEYIFNWPGLSSLLIGAVTTRDYPMVVGVILVISVLLVGLNLLVDLLYAVIDPRLSHR